MWDGHCGALKVGAELFGSISGRDYGRKRCFGRAGGLWRFGLWLWLSDAGRESRRPSMAAESAVRAIELSGPRPGVSMEPGGGSRESGSLVQDRRGGV